MIVLAEYGSGIYDIVLFLHVIAAFVAFAPAFVNPVFAALGRTDAPEVGRPLAGIQAKATKSQAQFDDLFPVKPLFAE